MARYEIRSARDGAVLSRHRTRQGSLDGWRERHLGTPIVIVRTYADGGERVVVEGTWHGDDDTDDTDDDA